MTHNSRRDRKSSWPAVWQVEVERLSELYVDRLKAYQSYDQSSKNRKTSIHQLGDIQVEVNNTRQTLECLLSDKHLNSIVRLATARMERESPDLPILTNELIGTYVVELQCQLHTFHALNQDIDDVVKLLKAWPGRGKGNQSTVVMRLVLYAAAGTYHRLFKKPPGRSNSDEGTFGKFVAEIFNSIPKEFRPAKRPSTSAVADTVTEWRSRNL